MRRMVLSVLALVVAVGVAGRAAAEDDLGRLADTKWKCVDSTNGKEARFEFAKNGMFTFTAGADVVKGIYSVDGDALRLKVIGKNADGKIKVDTLELKLVSLDDDRMVTSLN